MRIAVLGGGHGAYAAAADLGEQGHEVALWRRDGEALAPLAESRRIGLSDIEGSRQVEIAKASTDLGEVVAGAELIVMPGPATAQRDIARALAPHLVDGQVIFLPPGTFGSYLVAHWLHEAGSRAEVTLGETGTLPYLARKQSATDVAIVVRATRLPTGIFPTCRADHAFAAIEAAYPAVERRTDALDGALMNAGPIIHPPLIIMNAGPIQHFEHWDIHNEGTQPAIRDVTTALDGERIQVREALGYGEPHFPLADHYASKGEEWMYGRQAHAPLVESEHWRESLDLHSHRYMREDVELGLAFLVSLADYAGVWAPVASGLLALGSAIVGIDFRDTGRSLDSAGLAGLSRDELATRLAQGFYA
ncbi:MAG: NAD/NADP octopine/nopaline dehydrogenase family protein [Alphaproteobacteria bacterium]|jgi:opine dehydrogenase|nr:glycerol-3-phosphate dehydrogenase [Rhodospirillaceae bacterium]MDP6406656.1 NAD/NADP octopine/nopaline dehydrogenase family protein [Alphaproteobacteria bacterium]MDP6621503.1 NAD/NADP octopine/nopaline dehydrogenase family protein [Alphaproteobacteria bacterium]|tara:strand:+ start:965 stop:2053 length:1089 start_codon:yes stop_codon:yes gene_type:complete